SDPNTVLLALQYGDADAARIMARPLLEESPSRASALRLALASRAARERSEARRGRSGKMGSNRSPDDYLALAERLERFLAELPG
ncbi:SMI1/KNR4 family protein, partial [Pseudomonas aeruginosa]|nr:SMI1/KNR4 family protein [Pseudomonas aeruginosa]